jgi:hypothetical protein
MWWCKMPKTTKPNKQTVAEAVHKYIKDQHPGGATFEGMAPGIRKERYWWYVPVRPSMEPEQRYEYYEALAAVEEALAEHEHLTVFLVPSSPE